MLLSSQQCNFQHLHGSTYLVYTLFEHIIGRPQFVLHYAPHILFSSFMTASKLSRHAFISAECTVALAWEDVYWYCGLALMGFLTYVSMRPVCSVVLEEKDVLEELELVFCEKLPESQQSLRLLDRNPVEVSSFKTYFLTDPSVAHVDDG